MGDTRSEKSYLVRDMWRDENNDLHIITSEDEHLLFKGVSVISHEQEIDPTIMKAETVVFKATNGSDNS